MKWKPLVVGIATAGALTGGGSVVADNAINPYLDKGTTLEVNAESALPEGGEVKNILSKEEPTVTLSRWNGEVALKVKSLDLPSDTIGTRPFLSKNVEWDAGKMKMEAVPLDAGQGHEDGGVEINIILDSKPASNVFEFAIQGADDLDFFYQPPLTEADVSAGMQRPDNVVGSYAVYYKGHANHIEGKTNYATGKAYHIYRPLVSDSGGAEVWADLSYSNGILLVTVPQAFLDAASFPVRVDPMFGYTSSGASTANIASQNNAISTRVGAATTTPEAASVVSLSADLSLSGGAADTVDVTMFLSLEDGAGANSHSQIAKVENLATSYTTTKTFYTFTAASEAFTAAPHIINIIGDGSDISGVNVTLRVSFDTGISVHQYSEAFNSNTYTTGRDESPWGTTDFNSTTLYSMYVTYASTAVSSSNSGNDDIAWFNIM